MSNWDDEIYIKNTKKLESVFKLEKDLVDYIVLNIDLFAKDILDDEVVSFEVDKPINKQICFSQRGRRIDIFIVGKKKIYIIECKNAHSGTENRAAIGQILDYGREYTDSKKELIIITSHFDIETAKTIKHYNLPIRYIYINKKQILEFKEECKNGESWETSEV